MRNNSEVSQEHGSHSPELEPSGYHSRIVLNFFRHADKPKAEPGQTDESVRLTPTGRQQSWLASDSYHSEGASPETSLAMGGPRERSQETAGWVMAGDLDKLKGDESLEELKAILDKEQKFGSKLGVDNRLNFEIGEGEYADKLYQAYGADKNGLRWLIDESDKLAKKTGQTNATSYSTGASQIAEIIKKYENIAPRFDALVEKYKDEPAEEDKRMEDTMQRFFGSHLSVPDAFLAKLIEITDGTEERDRFVTALDNHGLDFVEGFQAEIKTASKGQKPTVEIHYEKKNPDGKIIFEYNEVLDEKLLDQIIDQGKETIKS